MASTDTVLYARDAVQPCVSGRLHERVAAPNGSADAGRDAEVNTRPHEDRGNDHRPDGQRVVRRRGYENADKCAWTCGNDRTPRDRQHREHQLWAAKDFLVQQNWVNADRAAARLSLRMASLERQGSADSPSPFLFRRCRRRSMPSWYGLCVTALRTRARPARRAAATTAPPPTAPLLPTAPSSAARTVTDSATAADSLRAAWYGAAAGSFSSPWHALARLRFLARSARFAPRSAPRNFAAGFGAIVKVGEGDRGQRLSNRSLDRAQDPPSHPARRT